MIQVLDAHLTLLTVLHLDCAIPMTVSAVKLSSTYRYLMGDRAKILDARVHELSKYIGDVDDCHEDQIC